MHEMGIIVKMVEVVERVMDENNLSKVEKIILEVGEYTSVIPQYAKDLFPAATYKTRLKDTELEIVEKPGIAECDQCHLRYVVSTNEGICPKCKCSEGQIVSGNELTISQIIGQ